jgi:hypothetical protein
MAHGISPLDAISDACHGIQNPACPKGPVLARPGSAWLRESIPLTGVKRTEMLRRGNANYWTHSGPRQLDFAVLHKAARFASL